MSTPLPPAGWYNNPTGLGQRYWDGQNWTDSYSQTQSNAPWQAAAQDELQTGLVVAGYVFAVLIPIVGFILGIVAATRPSKRTSRQGVGIVVVSVVVVVIYVAVVTSNG
jgi:Protein of unknown function (DUF2510)